MADDELLAHIALGLKSKDPLLLTLKVGGIWISGIGISERNWIDELESSLMPKNFDITIQIIREVENSRRKDEACVDEDGAVLYYVIDPQPTYLHLKDAKVIHPETCAPPIHGLFRCRTDEVSAWIIGDDVQPTEDSVATQLIPD